MLFLPHYWPPIPNFIQIGQKTQKLEIFTFGRFWLVGLVGQKMVVGISNSFYVVFAPLLAPIPNFIQIEWKTWKLKNFHFWSILVDWAGRWKNGRRHLKLILSCFYAIISPHTKFHPNWTENTEVIKSQFFAQFFSFGLKKQLFQVHFPTEFFFQI